VDNDYDRLIELSFRHPYLLHAVLALSALHILHAGSSADASLYSQASMHSGSAIRLARPHITEGGAEHRDAIFNFSAFSSLYAIAEPPLRVGDARLASPTSVLTALLDAFKMARGIRAILATHMEDLKTSGTLDQSKWKDNRVELESTLDRDWPQMEVLKCLVRAHCSPERIEPGESSFWCLQHMHFEATERCHAIEIKLGWFQASDEVVLD